MAQTQVFDALAPIAQICRGCNTTTLTEAYVHAVRELCRKSRVYTSTLLGTTVDAQALYNLGSDAYSEVIGVRACSVLDDTEVINLDEKASGTWDANDVNDVPAYFDYVPEAQLALHPTPDAAYAITITLILQPKLGSNSIESSLLVKWDEAFRDGALAYLLALPGMAWTNERRADNHETKFRDWMNRATSAAERRYRAAGTTPW